MENIDGKKREKKNGKKVTRVRTPVFKAETDKCFTEILSHLMIFVYVRIQFNHQ
jgi:hypothetical protein